MPYSERLTWDGVALHAGGLPGYPESHGCVHLPSRFAELLFGVTQRRHHGRHRERRDRAAEVVHPAFLAPVVARGAVGARASALGRGFALAARGLAGRAVTVVVSGADRRILVLATASRSVGRGSRSSSPKSLWAPRPSFLSDAGARGACRQPRGHQWMGVPLPGPRVGARISKNPERLRDPVRRPSRDEVFAVLEPGATLYVTDAPSARTRRGRVERPQLGSAADDAEVRRRRRRAGRETRTPRAIPRRGNSRRRASRP